MPPRAAVAALCVALAVLGEVLVEALGEGNATHSFLECLSAVRGRASRASILNADADQRDVILGRVAGCAKAPVVRGLRAVREAALGPSAGDVRLWDGVVLHRLSPDAPQRPAAPAAPAARAVPDGDDDGLAGVHDVIVELDRLSRAYAMDVEVYPGVTASLHRDARSEDAVNLSFRLDAKALDTEAGEEGRDVEDDLDILEDRHDHKKKKVLKGLKKLKKKLAPYLPLLAIPLALQLLLLPLYMMALKVMALKSILLGKMTLMLVAFNILRNAQQRQYEDDHNSRVAAEYYGYHDDGIEYGGWVNRRAFGDDLRRSARRRR